MDTISILIKKVIFPSVRMDSDGYLVDGWIKIGFPSSLTEIFKRKDVY